MRPVYLRIVSDLHLEQFYGQYEEVLVRQFVPEDERDSSSVLLLAGDISSKPDQLIGFLQALENRFQAVFLVPGNHETYGHDIDVWNSVMTARIAAETAKVRFSAGKMSCEHWTGWRIIYGTLWADGGKTPEEQYVIGQRIGDFRSIKKNGGFFQVSDMMDIHKQQKKSLKKFLQHPFNGQTVVMTHHLPSYKLCPRRFDADENGGFASDCDLLLNQRYSPDLWVFGHTHDSIETRLGRTLVVSNPAGYRPEMCGNPFNQFSPKFVTLDNVRS
jgi:predicted phosphodiesterase